MTDVDIAHKTGCDMKVVLIPGMDGTAILFDPLIAQAPVGAEIVRLPLIQSSDAGYQEQASDVISRIGQEPVVLVAESYSGMVAYQMLAMECKNIKHVVFAASFISRPSWMAAIAGYAPVAFLKSRMIPKSVVGKILFGQFSSDSLVESFYRSLLSVENKVISHRLRQIATLQEPTIPIKVPCTYIRPRGDRLVSKRSIEPFRNLCEKLSVCEVEGTHFVLQTNPQACWQIIQRTID